MATKTKKTEVAFDFRTIKTFEDACKKEGINPDQLPDLTMIPEEFRKPLLAVYKLFVVFKAINNGWIADYSKRNQYKYYPWPWVGSSGFGFDGSTYDYVNTNSGVGARLCTDTSEKALYIFNQFEDLYKDWFLYTK